jgi:hypothetical protein
MLSQNVIGKSDQPVVYVSKLLNIAKHNYSTTHTEVLEMVFTLHKFGLLGSSPNIMGKGDTIPPDIMYTDKFDL